MPYEADGVPKYDLFRQMRVINSHLLTLVSNFVLLRNLRLGKDLIGIEE